MSKSLLSNHWLDRMVAKVLYVWWYFGYEFSIPHSKPFFLLLSHPLPLNDMNVDDYDECFAVASFYSYLCFLIISVGKFYVRTFTIIWERDTEWNEKHAYIYIYLRLSRAATMHNVLLDSLMNAILSIGVEWTKTVMSIYFVWVYSMHKVWMPNIYRVFHRKVDAICRQNDNVLSVAFEIRNLSFKQFYEKSMSKQMNHFKTGASITNLPACFHLWPYKLNERTHTIPRMFFII